MEDDDFAPSVWDTGANFTAQPFASGAVVSEAFQETENVAVINTASEAFDKKSEQSLIVKICDPEKHGDGMDAFITYSIVTQTSLTSFSNPKATVRRRYQDFLWLREQLIREHPAVILPPLPEKNRLEYLDRFSPAFIQRRQAALQRFLDRVCSHVILHKSDILKLFLEAKAAAFETAKQLKKTAMFEDISDSLMNSFSKLKRPNDRFVAVSEYIQKMEENLGHLERLHLRILKRQSDLAQELADVGSSFTLLSGNEDLTGEALQAVGSSTEKRVAHLKLMNENMQLDFLERIRDYLLYCQSIKLVLRTRDQRQSEYEDLCDYLAQQLTERDRLQMGQSAGVISGTWAAVSGGAAKTDDAAKQERIDKANAKVKELEDEVRNSADALKAFNLLVMQELDTFNRSKTDEFKNILRDYANIHIEYYRKSKLELEEALPTISSIKV